MMATMHDFDEITSADDFDNNLDTPFDPEYRDDLGLRSFLSYEEDDYSDEEDDYGDDEDEGIYDDEY